ncbi:pyruvate, phosphate dikinase [Conexibacter sp. JD483]|uniref:pyruvate, phosphate dikinase n=1 Tax=unclassified Conexibacter TaxID=2627773 RepID=UPI0027185808|nr:MULTISPECIES: pyruvate, phosphate dikinase [unclassified Conexibacter]MDO8185100.1 pyruvate, phosphate dikinase [Conexibacter sp. CPCC 205706]MDO8196810.1 pyruvate, phosphate dikinase [Conexibacter sp. CPCC 205762]MDR9368058.1 pyruvate, phosphate dikinase [Conexibacter sp. JD483]
MTERAVLDTTYVYDFSQGSRDMRELLGGKGANVAEMTRILGPERVPAGFTITTSACVAYMDAGRSEPDGLAEEVAEALSRLEQQAGKTLGDDADPLLVSVRSGARESMPGMMDTVLNLGLNDRSVEGLAAKTGNPRFAWDSYRRFVQMFGNVVRGVPGERIEATIRQLKADRGATLDTDLDVDALRELTGRFKAIFEEHTGEAFPQEPGEQLRQAIRAVFDSWMGERAIHYRRINRIPDSWGTAVNVQQMVFGNKGESSGSGVAFSRDEVTGAPEPSGDFLQNAQGEDVVSGVRNTRDIAELAEIMPAAHAELMEILQTLERHYGDMQDTEFTVEEGHLYMLQTRNAKRPAQAAVRFAVDAVGEGLLDRDQALLTIDASALDALLHPTFDPAFEPRALARGVAASPGAAKGEVVFTADEAVAAAAEGRAVVLVRPFTEADDVAGFHAARGILTSEGGKASHAALVARGMGRPCVCGASTLEIDVAAGEIRAPGGVVIRGGELIAINGSTGLITVDDVPLVEADWSEQFETVLTWADELRTLGIRANADTPRDARRAREFGAEGIGLCRTEHMFMAADRQPKMRAMIMAETEQERREALSHLQPLQQEDFEGLFEAMTGLAVCIRLLDPPLHEFLPQRHEIEHELEELRSAGATDGGAGGGKLAELQKTLLRVKTLEEVNPMLGTRGCRLGILYPEIYEMQVEAIFDAAVAVRERSGEAPHLEVMIPLVDYETELEIMRKLVLDAAAKRGLEVGRDFTVGTMIELPRACFQADLIAKEADFFSFGTNDLTQTALGFSRDDVESKFMGVYLERKILDRSPFETLDTPGVGQMVRMAAWLGRKTKHDLKLGVCGEHGGDPDSIDFFHHSGIDYVSCSPYRVPIARVAAARAAVTGRLAQEA